MMRFQNITRCAVQDVIYSFVQCLHAVCYLSASPRNLVNCHHLACGLDTVLVLHSPILLNNNFKARKYRYWEFRYGKEKIQSAPFK